MQQSSPTLLVLVSEYLSTINLLDSWRHWILNLFRHFHKILKIPMKRLIPGTKHKAKVLVEL